MGKRKRDLDDGGDSMVVSGKEAKNTKINGQPCPTTTIQIIVGTYEKVLHGIQATVFGRANKASNPGLEVEFADTFLLSSHGSAIRCLAISPPPTSDASKSQKVILASGSSDQVIHLYHISREILPRQSDERPQLLTSAGSNIVENPGNRELGSLQHHGGSINALQFPTRSKLLSAAEDNTIAVARTRDWTVLSTIKAPIPKAHGRPSGDTAPHGGTPAGVNDFAIHPSMKLMVSVGKGEKCMRLWNLVTGKKAGVLNFERNLLQGVGEGRWASGEGRRIAWNSLGKEFVVAFEKGCVVFGIDCIPKCRIIPSPNTKIHQLRYLTVSADDDEMKEVLALSTEDGRILFYPGNASMRPDATAAATKSDAPMCEAIGQLGGIARGLGGRIKDFEILASPISKNWIIITGSSDGTIRLWEIHQAELYGKLLNREASSEIEVDREANEKTSDTKEASAPLLKKNQIGRLLGTYETTNRITCLKAFVMIDRVHVATNGFPKSTGPSMTDGLKSEKESSMSN